MFDYWEKIQSLKEDDVLEEIKKLHDKYFKLSETSPMRNQLQGMISLAQSRYNDIQVFRQNEAVLEEETKTIDIGEIESTEYYPDYTKKEIMTHLAKFYYDRHGPVKEEAVEPAVKNAPEDTTAERVAQNKKANFEEQHKALLDDIPTLFPKDKDE